jgi:hypothetical protein
MLAIIFGLFASFWFALSMVLINRGVLVIDYFRGLLTNLGVNALFLWLCRSFGSGCERSPAQIKSRELPMGNMLIRFPE